MRKHDSIVEFGGDCRDCGRNVSMHLVGAQRTGYVAIKCSDCESICDVPLLHKSDDDREANRHKNGPWWLVDQPDVAFHKD